MALPSKLVSMHHERYHVSRFFSFASRSYFSRVLLSTIPVKYMIWPPIVDFPASGKIKKVFSLKFGHSEKHTKFEKILHYFFFQIFVCFSESPNFQNQISHVFVIRECIIGITVWPEPIWIKVKSW